MTDAAPDQSVEDVLASIKRVMAREPAPDPSRRATRSAVEPDPQEDVLELTDKADGFASTATLRATREKLQGLARLDRAAEEATAGGQTVDDLVRELMKPMLSAWLDKHLPEIVDDAVEREVRRITRS